MKKTLTKLTGSSVINRVGLSLLLIFLAAHGALAQTVITTGSSIMVAPGSAMISNDHLILQSGGSLNNQGTVVLKKNLENQNLSASSLGTGDFEFSGSGTLSQVISGQNVIRNLAVNTAAGVTNAGNTTVNGVLTLTNGLTSLGNFNLVLGPEAVVSGSPSATNMIVATGAGQIQKIFPSAGSSTAWNFTYPVGDATGTAEYSPVTLSFNSGTFLSTNYAGVNLVDGQYPGTATSYLSRFWNVTQSGISGFSCNATFQYPTADVVGTESDIFCFRVDPLLPWIAYNATNTGTHQLTAHGLSSFGIFTGNIGDAAVPPAIRSLQDKTITSGMVTCADATQTLLIAGNGTTYTVSPGGSVTHIAGQNILYEPGTTVNASGYMHGYISTIFCNPYTHPGAAPVFAGTGDLANPFSPHKISFTIYPNPTTGQFTLALEGDVPGEPAHVDIFGILGEKVFSNDLILERTQEFSLAERPAGVYVIHVASSGKTMTGKIIRL